MNDVTETDHSFLQKLYKEDDRAAAIFNWAAARKKDASFTNVDRLAWLTNLEDWEVREVAKFLQEKGMCRFIPGRKGYRSRIEWYYSIRSMAKIALGEAVELSEVSSDADEIGDAQSEQQAAVFDPKMALTIPQAKQAIALSLGIDPDKIEINIRA